MSNKYQKYVEILPTQTSTYVQLQNTQDNIVFTDLNYFANLWESEILIKNMTLTSTLAFPDNDHVKLLILSKLGLFQKFQHREMGSVIYECVYQQEKCRMDADIYWDCIYDKGGNVFHSRVQDKNVNANLGFSPAKGIQFQVLDAASTGALINQQTLLQKGQMANYFICAARNTNTITLQNVRIPLKYLLYNTLYQSKIMDSYLPYKSSELTFQFAQFDTFVKKVQTQNAGYTIDIDAIQASGLQSISYSNISLILNTVNYLPLEKSISFSYYHSLLEKQVVQTKQNEIDIAQDKSLIQLFFQYYPTQLLTANTINPGFVNQLGQSNIAINELHYGSDKILPRLTGDDQILKMYVQNQLRAINPKLDIDQFFKQTNVIPIVFDIFDGIGEMNPMKVRIRYETANTDYSLLMYQVTSRLVQISQDGIELIA